MPLDDLALADKPEAEAGEDVRAPLPEDEEVLAIAERDQKNRMLMAWCDPRLSLNIAEEIIKLDGNSDRLSEIGQRVIEETALDEKSREDWLAQSKEAMDLAMQVAQTKTYPWPNASNVIYPLMSIASVQFAARAYPAVVLDRNVVRGTVYGDDEGVPVKDPATGKPLMGDNGGPVWAQDELTGDPLEPGMKRKRADNIGEHMSYQLLEEQPEWEPETDKLLHILPIVGCAFRKSFFDQTEKRNAALLVSAKNLIINYWAKSLETAPRVTEVVELYPYEIEEAKRSGVFIDQDYGPPEGASQDRDAPHQLLEQHRRWDLDGDGYAEPYIVTVHKGSQKVARIVARFDRESVLVNERTRQIKKIIPTHYYTKYDFLPNPDGGIYGVGFGQLLSPINHAVNSSLNLMFDAEHLKTVGGGFIGKGLSMHTGAVRFRPGEYKMVNAPGRTVRESVVTLEHQGASPVLFQLLGFLVEAGKDVASIKDILTGEKAAANTPATTIMAMIEQGLKVFTAIYKRIHRALKQEFDKQFRLNRIYLEEMASYQIGGEARSIRRVDYLRGSGVAPVSDPKSVSDMQKLAKAEFLKLFANDPLCDGNEIRRRVFEAANIEDIDQILKPNPPPDPMAIAKVKELEIKEMGAKALAYANMALAVERLANADAKTAETFNTWLVSQMTLLQQQMEAINGTPGQEAGPAAGSPGNPGGAVPGLAPSPGNAPPSGLPF